MKKLWIPFVAGFLAFVFIFTVQSNSYAAVGNYSVSTYIKGTRNNHWTPVIAANSNHTLYVVVDNYNKFDIRYYLMDVKTKKKISATDGVSTHGLTNKGEKRHIFKGLYGKYQLRIYCSDDYWDDNTKKCNAKATVYNYKPKGFTPTSH
ncbi:hypothetical protein MK805_10305 [Shimazuella sp. AN120528]|uniref:hypothetical protein n=1 Tax=Shimazuella soli TaxID=1892854 RepID=UPI001F0FC145|nr:hypothetical protein [Shimazuella soli]MCH5585362.1 hypothetical protein [Shimazuella soli]